MQLDVCQLRKTLKYFKILEIEIYKIRLIHVFILFSTFRPLLKALSSYLNIFLETELS